MQSPHLFWPSGRKLFRQRSRTAQGRPVSVALENLPSKALQTSVRIQQRKLGIATQKRMVGVLTMDICQQIAGHAQLAQDYRRSIQPRLGSTTAFEHPAQEYDFIFSAKRLLDQPVAQRPIGRNIECGNYLGPCTSGTDDA